MEYQVYRLIKGKFGEEVAEHYKNADIGSVDSFITNLKTKGSNYILTLVDWYILSIKYPSVFKGTNYGCYRILFNDTDIAKSIPTKMYSECDEIKEIVDYFASYKMPYVFLILDAFRNDQNYGILFSMAENRVNKTYLALSNNINNMRKTSGKNSRVFRNIKNTLKTKELFKYIYGYNVDVFQDGFNLISLNEASKKLNIEERDAENLINIFNLSYKWRMISSVIGCISKGTFKSLARLYKDNTPESENEDLGVFRMKVCRMKNFYDYHERFPTLKDNRILRNWLVEVCLKNYNGQLSDEEQKCINENFPDMFELADIEVIWARNKTYKPREEINYREEECEIEGLLRGKIAITRIFKLIEEEKVYTIDDYIEKIINGKKLNSPLSIVDWYILSIKYPEVFNGWNYGYYNLVCNSCICDVAIGNGVVDYILSDIKSWKNIDDNLINWVSDSNVECEKNFVLLDHRIGCIELVGNFKVCFDLENIQNVVPELIKRYTKKDIGIAEELSDYLKIYFGVGIDVFTLPDMSLDFNKSDNKLTLSEIKDYIGMKEVYYYEDALKAGFYIESIETGDTYYFNKLNGLYLDSDGNDSANTSEWESKLNGIERYKKLRAEQIRFSNLVYNAKSMFLAGGKDWEVDSNVPDYIRESLDVDNTDDEDIRNIRKSIIEEEFPYYEVLLEKGIKSGDTYDVSKVDMKIIRGNAFFNDINENIGFRNSNFYNEYEIKTKEDYIEKYLKGQKVGYILSPVDWYVMGKMYGTDHFNELYYPYYLIMFSVWDFRYDMCGRGYFGNVLKISDKSIVDELEKFLSMSDIHCVFKEIGSTYKGEGRIGYNFSRLGLVMNPTLIGVQDKIKMGSFVRHHECCYDTLNGLFGIGRSLKEFQEMINTTRRGMRVGVNHRIYEKRRYLKYGNGYLNLYYNEYGMDIIYDIIGYIKNGVFISLNTILELEKV